MAITAQQVKELRELTDCGIMDCKKALTESDGDIEKAKAWLREKGMAKAEKKAGRVAAEGAVCAIISDDNKSGCLVEINIETDFAAATDKFKNFASEILNQIMATKPCCVEKLNESNMYNDSSKTVEAFTKEAIANIGENTNIRRFSYYETTEGAVSSYIHAGGKVGAIVEFKLGDASLASSDEFKALGKDIGMQIAAASPLWVSEDEVPQEELDKEIDIIRNKALEEGKPAQIIDTRIVPGQIKNFYKLNVLNDQEYVKDDSKTVLDHVNEVAKALGTDISISKFSCYRLGEGIEKKEDDFAAEVAKQLGN